MAALFVTTLLGTGAAMADRPAADWTVSIEQALVKAKQAGYTQVHAIEADDNGYWEGEGMKQDGKLHEFRIDGKNGAVMRDQLD